MSKNAIWIMGTMMIMGGTLLLAAISTNSRMDEIRESLLPSVQEIYSEMNVEGQVVSAELAKELVQEKYDGQVENVELKASQETVYYEIATSSGEENDVVYINYDTGEFIERSRMEADRLINQGNVISIISIEQAMRIAIDQVRGEIKSWKLGEKDGKYEYTIKLKTKEMDVHMTIDASNGKVLVIEMN